jgi:putative ABC transport system permease protein
MASFWRNIRFGGRMLAKAPGHSAAAVIALSLGIGLTTATFSIVYGILWRGMPYPQSDRLVRVEVQNPSRGRLRQPVDRRDYLDWCQRQRSLEGLAGFTATTVTVSGDDRPERLDGAWVTANTLDLLRVKPLLGRGFRAGEDRPGATPVVVLSYQLWQDRYNGDPTVIGKGVRVNGQAASVIGVMPPRFHFPDNERLWVPLVLDPATSVRGNGEAIEVFGRLRPEVTRRQAGAEMAAIARSLAAEYPRTNQGATASVTPMIDRVLDDSGHYLLYSMLGAVGGVLLIACINVASLIMSRATQRSREMAVRAALGASRRQVVAQVLTETLILALAASVAGLGLAWTGIAAFNRAILGSGVTPPVWMHITLDLPVLLFALTATLGAAVVSGLVPALKVSRTRLHEVLKDEGRGSTSLRLGKLSRIVVVAELALSCVLLVVTGMEFKSAVLARSARFGFAIDHTLHVRVPLFETNYPQPLARGAFYQRLLERLRELPGVEAVGASTVLPSISPEIEPFAIDGRAYAHETDYPVAHSDVVAEGTFAAMGMRPLAGREFERLDTARSQPVAIVNQSLAHKLWPHDSALGKRLRRARAGRDEPWRTVVGVVPDTLLYGIGDKQPDGFFLPVTQVGTVRLSYVLRTRRDPLSLVPAVRAQVAALDRDTPIYFVRTMEQNVAMDRYFNELFAVVFAIFGLCALVLAAVGIYGVIAFSVERRTQEIGVRMALGARRRDVLAMLMRQGALQLGIGLAVGLPLAYAFSYLVAQVLFRVQPGDSSVLAAVTAGMSLVALFACLVPGQRATQIDPSIALRADV